MRVLRNLLITLICIALVGAAVIFGYFQLHGHREKALLEEGLALMEQGNYRLAREKFAEGQQYENSITRHLATDSMEEDLYKYVAICDFRLGEMDEAASIYDRLLRIHPKDPLLMQGRATVYAAQGQMEEARKLFDLAIGIDSSDYSHIYTAAMTLRQYGDPETGRVYLETLLADHGEELDPLTKGQALCFVGQYKEAEEILSGIANPDMQTTFLLASAREYNGKHEEALALFEQALPLAQEGTALQQSILFNRIAALENLRDFAKAKELAAQYSELYPDDARMNRENLFLQSR